MSAQVVYESMFGNTRTVAEAVADGIREWMPVDVVEVGAAVPFEDLDVGLLVVGAPTHAFGLSRRQTRLEAARRTGTVISQGPGLREWLETASPVRLVAAAFDTHVKSPNIPGRAGRVADKRLRGLGCEILARPASFMVHGYEGPLCAGELERATTWGTELAQLATEGAARRTQSHGRSS